MKEITLTKGMVAIVDDEDYVKVSMFKWHCANGGYAARVVVISKNRKTIYMHQYIIGMQEGLEIDHINGNRLDNRRANLRHVTHQQNLHNSAGKGGSSQYRGVWWDKARNKWRSGIRVDGKTLVFGRFDNELDAAIKYNETAEKLYGEYARLNKV